MMNNRGQSLMEFAVILIVAKALLLYLGAWVYVGWAAWILDRHLYEGLICRSHQSHSVCSSKIKDAIESHLPWGHLKAMQILDTPSGWKGQLSWQWRPFAPLKVKMHVPRSAVWR